MKKLGLFLILFALFCHPVHASQSALVSGTFPTVSPYPGLTLVQNINTAMQAINSTNAGSSAPSYEVQGTLFANSGSGLVEFYSGSNWLNIGSYSASQFVPVSNGVPLGTCPTATGSSNAYVVTYSPVPTALVSGQEYCFKTNFAVTGAATVNFNSLGAKNLTKQGATALASGDVGNSTIVKCVYDGTQCQITSELSTSGSGTVTSVSGDGTVISGTITTSGSFTLANAGSWSILNNNTSGSHVPVYTSTPSAQAYYLGTTQAASAGKTGVISPASNALALETTGGVGIEQYSDQGVTVGSPTGGDQGAGTLNAVGLYVNGVATPSSAGKTAWTPILKLGGATTGITYSTQSGTYVQIGKIVDAEFDIVVTGNGATGGATITGLGITSNGSAGCSVPYYTGMSGVTGGLTAYYNGTTINLAQNTATAISALNDTNFVPTTEIRGSCIFIAN